MKITSYYPVIMTDAVDTTSAFWRTHFDFAPVFESDWYVHLQHSTHADVNIAVLHRDHQTIPVPGRGSTAAGLLINFEVEDVDAFYSYAQSAKLPILLDLRDEAFGQRHFITNDPNGVMIDIIKPIAPSEEFLAQYQS
ncbi:Glyoxalase/Bleomycin resistance protein/Dioxygenase superfamily protein [Devosia crocina]|uniref:Glyoxalase/Bleomycin resistance protein/Dioxygenase superfamily protein n=1 Tax=Devosia crocina TaxID=429728 RepID=A0A1I7N2E8_9HYPH|nr:VOC family protein [Devosia crocina]SFV28854.1 Glyoxalase/Bleomycin resistance protein/Dioxygenase superfamily protein [Devosia crocina]